MRALRRRSGRALRRGLSMVLASVLAGCQTMAGGGSDVSCEAFGPLSWSREDTVTTAQGVREHNAAWMALCQSRAVHG